MRSFIIPAAFAAFAVANPMPQDIDWDAVDALDPAPTVSIPIVDAASQATTVSYTAGVAASTVSADIAAVGLATAAADVEEAVTKRDAGSPDTPEAFAANPYFASVATAAPTPTGYVQTFSNLNGSNNAYGYMGYTVLNSYDTLLCSQKCDAIDGCASFNLCKIYRASMVVTWADHCRL